MIGWIVSAYLVAAAIAFILLVRFIQPYNYQPFNLRMWLGVVLMAIFWPAAAVWFFV